MNYICSIKIVILSCGYVLDSQRSFWKNIEAKSFPQ